MCKPVVRWVGEGTRESLLCPHKMNRGGTTQSRLATSNLQMKLKATTTKHLNRAPEQPANSPAHDAFAEGFGPLDSDEAASAVPDL